MKQKFAVFLLTFFCFFTSKLSATNAPTKKVSINYSNAVWIIARMALTGVTVLTILNFYLDLQPQRGAKRGPMMLRRSVDFLQDVSNAANEIIFSQLNKVKVC